MAEDIKPGFSVFLKAPLICLPVSFIEAAGLGCASFIRALAGLVHLQG